MKVTKSKKNNQVGIKFPNFRRMPSWGGGGGGGGGGVNNWTWVKTQFTQRFLKYQLTKTRVCLVPTAPGSSVIYMHYFRVIFDAFANAFLGGGGGVTTERG